jgi:exodeoxyribonuclease VII large subunit
MQRAFQEKKSSLMSKPPHIYTVSELTQEIKLILENSFPEVWVEGEVSGFTRTAKGIIFFSLKDNAGLLKCVMFNSFASAIKFKIQDGMSLICFGRIGVYEKEGRYQLYVENIEPKGIGSLQLALEQLKQKLEKEGLFSPARKRPIPYLPAKIGIVTSLSGAAIKDILRVLERRFSDMHIIIRAAQVQGEEAKEDIAQAIKDFNCLNESLSQNERIEVMIVGRGGGSIEDLWVFNEEIVCRAIYNSRIPIISAIGHERDVTLSDLVADLRAATPSVAAELVMPKKEDLKKRLKELRIDIVRSFSRLILNLQDKTGDFNHRLNLSIENQYKLSASEFAVAWKKIILLNPAVLIKRRQAQIQDFARQIYIRTQHFLALRKGEFKLAVEKLASLSPLNILGRGYSITFKMPEEIILKDARSIKEGDNIKTKLHKGEVISQVREVANG